MTDPVSVLDLSHDQAKTFFLRPSCFCNIDLPSYFSFDQILNFLSNKNLASIKTQPARAYSDVNYTLIANKDGKYAWRPLQILNPVIYVKIVDLITSQDHWQCLRSRFLEFQQNPQIQCVSIPVCQEDKKNNTPLQILTWWSNFEQRSIQLSLNYSHVLSADITNCYGSVYTHAISWAIHDLETAKKSKGDHKLLGNAIDDLIEDMRFGQTNGISQGSVLMDFIAEIVLGYVDNLLTLRLNKNNITGYQILRYRDDYRIFVNDLPLGESILKELAEILCCLGMSLNSSKTAISSDVVSSSVKSDKRAWLALSASFEQLNIQKKLFLLLEHSMKFPNSGSLLKPLTTVYKILPSSLGDDEAIISIITEIAYKNPRTYPVCMAILAKLMEKYSPERKTKIGNGVLQKFRTLPNTEYLDIWLQRILFPAKIFLPYSGFLTQLVDRKGGVPWNFEWITSAGLKNKIQEQSIIDRTVLESITPIIPTNEVDAFADKGDDYMPEIY